MSANVWLVGALVAITYSLVPRWANAHVPWVRAALPELLQESDCIITGRVDASEADPRGRGVALIRQPASWCGATLPAPLRIRTATALPTGGHFVFFARKDASGWRDLAAPGIVLPLNRSDQRLLHRTLVRLWKERPTPTRTAWRHAALRLLAAKDETWRYHAAVTLATTTQRRDLDAAERAQVAAILHSETDPAIRHLLEHISGGVPASAP
ncbi:MAG: hypothetical protein N3C12_10400 [Candidatus Binatia bacterium]|nr:hypothetical protein [Candidatus Binatia bacterium]